MSGAYRGPSHADVCRRRAGTGECDCCAVCGDHRYAATDGRCLVCHPQPLEEAELATASRRPDRVVTRTDAGAVVLVDTGTGEVLEEDAPAEPVCEFEPLDPLSPASEFAPVANAVPANVSPEHPEPSATDEDPYDAKWTTCPGGCGVVKRRGEEHAYCRTCDGVPPAPVSHATDPDLVVADAPGIVGNASPPTSHAAAAAVPTGKRRQEVLMALARERTGATAEELEASTGRGGSTIRPRLLELERDGFVERTEATRPTRSGLQAVVWAATPRGVSAADRLAGRPDGMP